MDAFISYRREGGFEFSARLHERLRALRYLSFFDVENVDSGKFDEQLLRQIEKCPNFILVLSPNCFDRCKNKDDWVRTEIAHALKKNKNIILILLPGFDFPDTLPSDIKDVRNYQGVQYFNWNFAQTVDKVISYLKNEEGQPLAQAKQKIDNNTYYSSVGLSEEEISRMHDEMRISSIVEKPFLEKALEGKHDLIGFATSLYGAKITFDYLSHPAFKKVFLILPNAAQREATREIFNDEEKYIFFDPVDDNEAFEALLKRIENKYHIKGFDFFYLNLALMDSDNPLKKLQTIRDHLNDEGMIFVREIDDNYVCAFPDPQGLFEKAISMISDDKYAGNRRIGREIYTLMKMVGAKEIHRCPDLLTTAEMSHRNKERTFHAWFGYQIAEFTALLEEEPDNLLYKADLQWYQAHLPEMEKSFLSDDFFFSCGFVYYYAIFDNDD